MLKFSESFHLHHNCCMTKQWRMAHPTRKAEEEAQTLSDGPCNAYQDNAPLMCTQHSRKPVHNTRYMLQVCLQRKPLERRRRQVIENGGGGRFGAWGSFGAMVFNRITDKRINNRLILKRSFGLQTPRFTDPKFT